jgi:hypothetical protein
MASTITPNMGLIVPGVATEPGPTWANDLNASLGILDEHNHSPGQGVQITPAGIDINVDLPMNGNNLTLVNTVRFSALGAPLAGLAPNLGAIYVAGNELYYNDEAGNVVAITNNGSVNAGAGSITGLPSGTASASYSAGSQTFVWQSATSTPANMDGGSFIFRDIVANSNGVTISAPIALAADYQMFLPASLPGSQKFLTLDSSGNIAAQWDVDNVTIEVNSNLLRVVPNSITFTQLAPRATGTTAALGEVGISPSSNTFTTSASVQTAVTNLSVTITTGGSPVRLLVQADGNTANENVIKPFSGSAPNTMAFFRDATQLCLISANTGGNPPDEVLQTVEFIDTPAAGTYTYTFTVNPRGQGNFTVNYVVLVVYEL